MDAVGAWNNNALILAGTDGGVTWAMQATNTYNGLTGVGCTTTKECFAAGKVTTFCDQLE